VPKVVNAPTHLRPYLFHGLKLDWRNGTQALGECPFCGKKKFYVGVSNGLWDCKVCGAKGNSASFLKQLLEISDEGTSDYSTLAEDRGLLYPETLIYWGVAQSDITSDWLVPGYNAEGKLIQLYRYVRCGGKSTLFATPQANAGLYGVNLHDKNKRTVYVCEGPWDGMALWEVLRRAKDSGNGNYIPTASKSNSLYASANVVAVPGCGSVGEPFARWLPLFAGKRVVLMFDNDHPRKHPTTKVIVEPAGYLALKRAVNILASAEEAPAEVLFLQWGKDYNHDPSLSDGYDVRDWLTKGLLPMGAAGSHASGIEARVGLLKGLLDKISLVSGELVVGQGKSASTKRGVEIACLPCDSWMILERAWRKALHWTEGLDRALSVMLSCVASTNLIDDQLWCRIIGPASCGKSTLCEALSICKKYVYAKSTIRGFHSGYKADKEGAEDFGLIPKVRGKTLVTKDGDTLLQSPNLSQILSEARDLYDSTARVHYRHGISRDHEGVRMTWLLCGTNSLRQLDSSELGERFLDCVIMEDIDEKQEDDVLWRIVNRAVRNSAVEADEQLESQYDPELVKAMQLTGGYVSYLREHVTEFTVKVEKPDLELRRCMALGKFVAYMRARPSLRQDEIAEREFAGRLVSQLMRLAQCMAVVLNRDSLDQEVMRRVTRTALDTARGRTFDICKQLAQSGVEGIYCNAMTALINVPEAKVAQLLGFLRKIKVVERFRPNPAINRGKWRLTERLRDLWNEVLGCS